MSDKKIPVIGKRRIDKFMVAVYVMVAFMFLAQIAIIVAFDVI